MNARRLAELFQERAALDLEIAKAILEEEPKPRRKKHTPEPKVQPSQETIDRVRRQLRKA